MELHPRPQDMLKIDKCQDDRWMKLSVFFSLETSMKVSFSPETFKDLGSNRQWFADGLEFNVKLDKY